MGEGSRTAALPTATTDFPGASWASLVGWQAPHVPHVLISSAAYQPAVPCRVWLLLRAGVCLLVLLQDLHRLSATFSRPGHGR